MGFKTINCCGRPGRTYAAGVTQFASTTGLLGTNTVETRAQVLINSTITWAALLANVSANSLTAASTVQTRKNASPGAQSVSISNGATGTFEDAGNTDSLIANDLADYQIAAGGATGSLTLNVLSSIFIATTGTFYNVANSLASTFSVAASFIPLTTTLADKSATESNSQYTIRASGTFSQLTINVTANTTTAASTLNFRKNTNNGNQVVTISNGATGRFTDAANTDAVVSGDVLDYGLSLGGAVSGSISCTTFQTQFQDSTLNGFVAMNGDALGSPVLTGASTYYLPFQGAMDLNISESLSQMKTRSASTFSKFFVRLIANTLTAASTAGFRKNTANGNMSVSISNGATGTFEDQTNTDAASATDLVNYFTTQGGTTASLQATIFGVYTQAYGKITETDDLRVFDGPVRKQIFNILTSAAVRIADSITKNVTKRLIESIAGTISGPGGIQDYIQKKVVTKNPTDAVSIRDYLAKRAVTKALTDILRVNDFVKTTPKAIIRMFEKVRVNDYLSKRALTKTFTDMVRVTDRTAKTVTKSLLDIVRIVDRATATLVSGVKQILVTDTLRIVDFVAKQTTKLLIDPIRIRDYLANRQITKVFADAVRIFDSQVKKTISNIIRTDAVRIVDRTAKTVTKRFLDIVRITDAENLVKSFVRSFTDAIRVVDRTTKTTTKQLRDVVRIRDRFSRVLTFTRMFTDSLRIADRTTKSITKILSHIIRIADTARATRTMFVVVSDMVRVTDSIAKTITKRLADVVRIRDTITTFREVILTLVDAMRIQDFTTKTITKRLLDILRIVDQASASFVGGHIFTVMVSEAVRVIGVPIGSIVTIIHQGAAAIVEAAKSIGHALENALHPGSKRKGSLGEADS